MYRLFCYKNIQTLAVEMFKIKKVISRAITFNYLLKNSMYMDLVYLHYD